MLAVCVISTACYRVVVVSQLDGGVSGACCTYVFSYSTFMNALCVYCLAMGFTSTSDSKQ